jgi:glutathione synthase/RimK-type ligase-like ATP-grasp enzyme
MTAIAILTPDPADPTYSSQWPQVLDPLAQALAREGLQAVARPWTEQIDDLSGLDGFPLILPLVTWGYHREPDRWLAACAAWDRAGLPVANAPDLLAWNTDKAYLAELAGRGVAIATTLWVETATQAAVDAAFAETGAPSLVVKPTVSGGAWRTLKLSPGQAMIDPPPGRAMIQPYLPTIETEGETSLLFFGGRFSHAVNKRPAGGDFRIQTQFGGRYEAVSDPAPGAMALAQQTLAAIGRETLYVRIDMAPDETGRWLLMEAELIEPDFYLAQDPAGGAGFARAVRDRISASRP